LKTTVSNKPLTKKELAALYQVNVKTFCRWLVPFHNEIGKPAGNFYLPKQVVIIFDKIGPP